MPLQLTVVIPTVKRPRLLKRCLASDEPPALYRFYSLYYGVF